MAISRRKTLGCIAGSLMSSRMVQACSFGSVEIKLPLSLSPGSVGFSNVIEYLRSLEPDLVVTQFIETDAVLVGIDQVAENDQIRPITIDFAGPLPKALVQREVYVILESDIGIINNQGSLISACQRTPKFSATPCLPISTISSIIDQAY